MKLMFCEECGSLVVPQMMDPQYCRCRRAAVWWIDPIRGKLGVWHHWGSQFVSVIGLHNGLLTAAYKRYEGSGFEKGVIDREQIEQLLAETPDSYVFKSVNSLAIKVRPGFSHDVTFYERLAEAFPEALGQTAVTAPPPEGINSELGPQDS